MGCASRLEWSLGPGGWCRGGAFGLPLGAAGRFRPWGLAHLGGGLPMGFGASGIGHGGTGASVHRCIGAAILRDPGTEQRKGRVGGRGTRRFATGRIRLPGFNGFVVGFAGGGALSCLAGFGARLATAWTLARP